MQWSTGNRSRLINHILTVAKPVLRQLLDLMTVVDASVMNDGFQMNESRQDELGKLSWIDRCCSVNYV